MASAGFGVKNSSGGFAFKVDPDGNTTIGDESSDVLQVTGSANFGGPINIAVTATDLGNGSTSTLVPTTSLHLLTATSITSNFGMHMMSIADGSHTGQLLKVVLNTTTNNNPIMINPSNILNGSNYSAIAIENNKQGAAFEFVWTGSKWALLNNNTLTSVG